MKNLLSLLLLSLALTINAQTLITATIPYQGYDETQAYLGQAEYQIFMDNTTNVLDKPIILLDGFDPLDGRDIPTMYSLLDFNGQNVGDILRNEGFDFVLLNFPVYTRASDNVIVDGGADYIQRNAMVLAELINQINTLKVGNEELVIIGPSMGGLIARYGLSYMEQNSLAHQTRLYISWDAPHLGANNPISMQYFMNYVAESQDNQGLKDLINASTNSPAAKEMLTDHFTAHLQNGSTFEQDPSILLPTGAVNFRTTFQNELDAIGFPQQVRNISVSNGSGSGANTGSPNAEIVNETFDVATLTTADVEIHFTPVANQTNEVTSVDTFFAGNLITTYTASAQSFPYTDGIDSAPGGTSDLQALSSIAQGNQLLIDFFNAMNQSEYCFIPTISSLAITNENDWYATPDIGNTHNSEFDAWYIPVANEQHVTATQGNVDFILPEIRNEVVGILDNSLANKYKLKTNPVSKNITIQLDNSLNYNNVNLSIANVTGQRLVSKTYNSVSNEINLPINLQNGVYFLTISDTKTKFSVKLIVAN